MILDDTESSNVEDDGADANDDGDNDHMMIGKKSNYVIRLFETWGRNKFLSAMEYHSNTDYNSRWVDVVVVVVVDHNFKNGLTFERLDRFASYLEGS